MAFQNRGRVWEQSVRAMYQCCTCSSSILDTPPTTDPLHSERAPYAEINDHFPRART